MPERTPYIAANWKMHKTVAEAAEFVDALLPQIAATQSDVVICPPFTALGAVVERRYGTAVKVAAQNMHEEDAGAYTGEVSAAMLVELDVEAVVLGHSERRQLFGETDEALARKVPAALAVGLQPILCIGETEAEWSEGRTLDVLDAQLRGSLPDGASAADLMLAYEPVWAIGTGRTPSLEDIANTHGHLRARLAELAADGDELRLLYGGSVKAANAREIMAIADVDGVLVGGASLDADEFLAIYGAGQAADD